ncbi:hypothetical protein Tco_0805578 [Tanacetum coccineum]
MMEQPVLSLIEETLVVIVVKLLELDMHVEELLMVSERLKPDTVVDDEVLDRIVIMVEDCKSVEKLMTTIIDTEKCCIENCCLDKKRCDDD